MKKSLLILGTLFLASAFGAPYKVNKGDVTFKAKGFPTFITIKGETQDLTGNLNVKDGMAEGNFKVALTTLKTGMELRDDHMINKYLEAKTYPHATLTLKPFKVQDSGTAQGELELHGQKKPVTVEYERETDGENVNFRSHFDIKITDFAIDIPSFQGITVAEDVTVSVNFKALK